MRLTAEPQGGAAWRYRIVNDGAAVCDVSFPLLGPSTATPIAGQVYRLWREGVMRNTFTLSVEGRNAAEPVARATQRHAARRDYAIEAGARRLSMRAESLARSGYALFDGDNRIGTLRPAGPLRRGVVADLPDDLPLEVGVLLLWIVLLLWRGRRVTRA